jgi:hypothetical protein
VASRADVPWVACNWLWQSSIGRAVSSAPDRVNSLNRVWFPWIQSVWTDTGQLDAFPGAYNRPAAQRYPLGWVILFSPAAPTLRFRVLPSRAAPRTLSDGGLSLWSSDDNAL